MEKINSEKEWLRKNIAEKRKKLSRQEVIVRSKIIAENFFVLSEFVKCQNIMFYLSFEQEVSTGEMVARSIQLKKRVLVPKMQGQNLSVWTITAFSQCLPNRWGIPEPEEKMGAKLCADWAGIELIVVPGLAFDCSGHRLGFGRGYYDRFLKQLPVAAFTVGLAFDFQITENIPVTVDDFSLDCVVSETKVYRA